MKGYRLVIAFTLIFVLLFSIVRNSLMLSLYLVDTEDFVELFCENKEMPELECNGKCELSKMANQDDQKPERTSLIDNLQNEWVYYVTPIKWSIFSLKSQINNGFNYQNHYLYLYSQPITHPPILI